MTDLQSGLGSAENVRGVWSGSKDNILDNNDKALASLTAVSEQMQAMVPHIESAKESAEIDPAYELWMDNNALTELPEYIEYILRDAKTDYNLLRSK